MAAASNLHCCVITPERQIVDTEAASVILPAHDGQIGILHDHAPLLCQLGVGTLRVESATEGMREFFVDDGFAQVLNNDVTVLTDRAKAAEDISRADAEKALAEAQAIPAHDEAGVEARSKAVARAKAQLHIATK